MQKSRRSSAELLLVNPNFIRSQETNQLKSLDRSPMPLHSEKIENIQSRPPRVFDFKGKWSEIESLEGRKVELAGTRWNSIFFGTPAHPLLILHRHTNGYCFWLPKATSGLTIQTKSSFKSIFNDGIGVKSSAWCQKPIYYIYQQHLWVAPIPK